MKIILASTSKYRSEQLSRITKSFQMSSPSIDEDKYKSDDISPSILATKLATLKALDVQKAHPSDLIIGGDQVLSFEGKIFSKPITKENAISQLRELSGKTHELITATTYIVKEEVIETQVIAKMKMRNLTDEQIENYINRDMPLNCCGSYMLENSGIGLFEEIDCKDYTSIIGLPLMSTANILLKYGFKVF
ncbi:nucleoside triphosphate pyrophosphatase [Halobacteriovorax sp. HLS]|uniref:Maf family protein n=1 Tax=Halobacteriovorax sp. HLS TaxID=2234000 RepID=UPI000FD97708|nr:Maf family protein [Halobacteriovorax sp. HLS]